MKDSSNNTIDFDKLDRIFKNYECDGQLSFVVKGNNLVIAEDTNRTEVKGDKVEQIWNTDNQT